MALLFHTTFVFAFDCSKSKAGIEKLICGDMVIRQFDFILQKAYEEALEKTSAPSALKAEQRAWLRMERDQCRDMECLRTAYMARITKLEGVYKITYHPTRKQLEAKMEEGDFAANKWLDMDLTYPLLTPPYGQGEHFQEALGNELETLIKLVQSAQKPLVADGRYYGEAKSTSRISECQILFDNIKAARVSLPTSQRIALKAIDIPRFNLDVYEIARQYFNQTLQHEKLDQDAFYFYQLGETNYQEGRVPYALSMNELLDKTKHDFEWNRNRREAQPYVLDSIHALYQDLPLSNGNTGYLIAAMSLRNDGGRWGVGSLSWGLLGSDGLIQDWGMSLDPVHGGNVENIKSCWPDCWHVGLMVHDGRILAWKVEPPSRAVGSINAEAMRKYFVSVYGLFGSMPKTNRFNGESCRFQFN